MVKDIIRYIFYTHFFAGDCELMMFVKNIKACQNEKDVGSDFVLT